MTTSRRLQQTMFADGLEPESEPVEVFTMWATPKAQEDNRTPEAWADFKQRVKDRMQKAGKSGGWPSTTGNLAVQAKMVQAGSAVMVGFSPQATPASRSATPGSGAERMTPGTSGRGFIDSLSDFRTNDRIGLFSKMFVATSRWVSTVCLMTWKASATPRGRGLYLLRVSARSTGVTGCGSSDAEAMWPTPIVGDAHLISSQDAARRRLSEGKATLSRAVNSGLWPTPVHRDFKATGDAESPGIIRGADRYKLGETAIQASGKSGQKLNPDFVERLMGFPPGWTVLGSDENTPVAPSDGESAFFSPEWGDSPLGAFGQGWEYGVPLTQSGTLPDRVNRLKALGNAIVPQVAFVLFECIAAAESQEELS